MITLSVLPDQSYLCLFLLFLGPYGNATQVKNHTLENRFHSECPANPAKCTEGFTVAFWFSVLANNKSWAEKWPGDGNCTLVSINDHIVVSSMVQR